MGLKVSLTPSRAAKHLQDAWTVNIHKKRDTDMLEQLFRDYLKAQQAKESTEKIEPCKELNDLVTIYEESEKDLKKREEYELRALQTNMKDYVEALNERQEMTNKLKSLKHKLENAKNKDEEAAE
jgi:predicted membrane chloride channel (bestrophin family)